MTEILDTRTNPAATRTCAAVGAFARGWIEGMGTASGAVVEIFGALTALAKVLSEKFVQDRGWSEEQAVALLVNGFVRYVLQKLPMEFAVEAKKLLEVSLEGAVG